MIKADAFKQQTLSGISYKTICQNRDGTPSEETKFNG
ncbi:unknown [Prevotella sp. CAG:255]|nr:unknown [Prevotella sp. CAG:255]